MVFFKTVFKMLILHFVELLKGFHVNNFIRFSVEDYGVKMCVFKNFGIRTCKTYYHLLKKGKLCQEKNRKFKICLKFFLQKFASIFCV